MMKPGDVVDRWTQLVDTCLRTLTARVADLEFKHKGMEQWHNELQKRVATLEGTRDKAAFHEHELKAQAAQAQATSHLYAPLRSDTRPLLEMSAFVRKVSLLDLQNVTDGGAYLELAKLAFEAAEIVKRNT